MQLHFIVFELYIHILTVRIIFAQRYLSCLYAIGNKCIISDLNEIRLTCYSKDFVLHIYVMLVVLG